MLIIPFIHKIINHNNINVHNIRLLTIGGKYLWEESDNSDVDIILKDNNIYCTDITQNNNMYLCKINVEKTDINDIYKWSEININDMTFCWKDYIYFIGKNNEDWLNIPKNEKIGDIYINNLLELIKARI